MLEVTSGCAGTSSASDAASAPGIEVREVATVRLGSRPGLAIAKPLALEIDARGDLYVADAFHDAVFVFSPAGELRHVVQHREGGRAEPFKLGGFIGTIDEGALVFDYSGQRIAVASRSSANPRMIAHYAGRLSGGRVDSAGVWLAMVDLGRGHTMTHRSAHTAIRDTVRADRLDVPEEYARSAMLAAVYDWVRHVRLGDTLVVGFSGLNDLIIADTAGKLLGRRAMPVARRRGVPASLTDRMAKGDAPFAESISGMSALFAMERLTGGRIGMVHIDQSVEQKLYRADAVWLTIVDAGLRRACVDIGIPVRSGSTPAVTFRGDTAITVQVSLDSAGAPLAEMRKFVADPASCSWADLR